MARLREQADAVRDATRPWVPAEPALAWIEAVAETRQRADLVEEQAGMIRAVCERSRGRATPTAYRHGLALALPEKVVLARPTGVGRGITTDKIPIEGRDEWLAMARRLR
jgi:hypothetical protein